MEAPRARQKALTLSAPLSPAAQRRLTHFKAFAISPPVLQRVDTTLMRAMREPAGFRHGLVYGPSGVGKSTMLRQIAQRLHSAERGASPGGSSSVPVLLLEAAPAGRGLVSSGGLLSHRLQDARRAVFRPARDGRY